MGWLAEKGSLGGRGAGRRGRSLRANGAAALARRSSPDGMRAQEGSDGTPIEFAMESEFGPPSAFMGPSKVRRGRRRAARRVRPDPAPFRPLPPARDSYRSHDAPRHAARHGDCADGRVVFCSFMIQETDKLMTLARTFYAGGVGRVQCCEARPGRSALAATSFAARRRGPNAVEPGRGQSYERTWNGNDGLTCGAPSIQIPH